jgi:tRNA U38,U39,U40 pseudouridine synthase TruA
MWPLYLFSDYALTLFVKLYDLFAGFLLCVGIGELNPEDVKRFLKSGMRTNEVPTVKPLGLFLWRVDY